ncbi:MAG: TIGR02281 family clan AA aspartic protease [Acidovorax sp.]
MKALAAALLLCPALACAQAVALSGILGSKALLVIDGGAPRALAAGEAAQGVRVVSVGGDEAVVQIGAQRSTLRLGESPVSVGGGRAGATGRSVVLAADSRGHFMGSGSINGRPIQYMVDTGASTIAISRADAERMGLPYASGQPVRIGTANGMAQGWRLRLDSVRIGDVQVFGVDAVVTPQAMPYVLLGNSFLAEFAMNRTGDRMVLEKR